MGKQVKQEFVLWNSSWHKIAERILASVQWCHFPLHSVLFTESLRTPSSRPYKQMEWNGLWITAQTPGPVYSAFNMCWSSCCRLYTDGQGPTLDSLQRKWLRTDNVQSTRIAHSLGNRTESVLSSEGESILPLSDLPIRFKMLGHPLSDSNANQLFRVSVHLNWGADIGGVRTEHTKGPGLTLSTNKLTEDLASLEFLKTIEAFEEKYPCVVISPGEPGQRQTHFWFNSPLAFYLGTEMWRYKIIK